MKLLLLVLIALLSAAAVACGSDSGTDDSGRSLPATNGNYERILDLARDDVATPDFTLGSSSGDVVRLSDYLGKQPVAVVFYRGFF